VRVKIVINPAAGSAEPILSVLNDVFGPAGIEWEVAVTLKAGDATAAARQAAEQGFDVVGVYGGDGTVAEVASALAEGGPPVLLLPGGTGNALAQELGIPSALADAAALVTGDDFEIRQIDVGLIGERTFVLRATMGLEVTTVDATTKEMKNRFGGFAYALAALQSISDHPVASYLITVDGQTEECEGIAAVIANSANTGMPGVRIVDGVDVGDGILDIVVLHSADVPGLLGSAVDAAQGQQPRVLSRWRGARIRVEANPRQRVLVDGEDAGWSPIEATVAHGALGVVVPKVRELLDS
jgi:YegS/Rv2252/BmrU family lipid kinase